MNIYDNRPLSPGDLQEVMKVFVTCFAEDRFYCNLFEADSISGAPAVKKELRRRFSPQIRQVLKYNLSFGAWDSHRLIAFILNFDYTRVLTTQPELFRSLFYDGDYLPYAEEMHESIRNASKDHGVLFLLSVAVLPEYRRQHIASGLLDTTLQKNPYALIASDVSNTSSLNMYRKRGFRIRDLEEHYHFLLGPDFSGTEKESL